MTGKWTIKVCGLNEGRRPRVRADAWLYLEDDLWGWSQARAAGDHKRMRRKEWRIRNQPFADVCHAALRQAVSDHAARIFMDTDPAILDLLRDEEFRATLLA